MQFNSTILNIDSSLVLDNATVVLISSDQNIQTKNVTFGGELKLVLTEQTVSQINNNNKAQVSVANYNDHDGQFSSLQVVNEDQFLCGITKSLQYGAKSMMVLLQKNTCPTVDSGGEGGKAISTGAIIGIVLGVCGFVVIIIVGSALVMALIAFLVRRINAKRLDDNFNLTGTQFS